MNKATWDRVKGVECVSCPDCAFTFDAAHTDDGGGYSCPACAETRLEAELGRAREENERLRAQIRASFPPPASREWA